MTPAQVWLAAKAAAGVLADIPGARVDLGLLSIEQVRELAREAGVATGAHVCIYDRGATLLESMCTYVGRVQVSALGSRPATAEDIKSHRAHRFSDASSEVSTSEALKSIKE